MHKATLRRQILKKRKEAHSPAVSASICEMAASLLAFKKARTVMVYLAKGSEVDTSHLIDICRKMGKTICAPRVLNDTDMEAALLDEKGLSEGAFGILEPLGPPVENIDIIFVPGAVFDRAGNRIGYGKGYYDRFLKRQSAATIGLSYACQVVDAIPSEAHDIRLTMILTEEGLCI